MVIRRGCHSVCLLRGCERAARLLSGVARGVSMERLSSFVLAHRRWIFAFWALLFVAGIAAAGRVPDRLSYDFSLPGQQGYETEQKIIASYDGANAQAAYVPVVTVPPGQTVTGSAADVQAVYDALRKIPTLRVVDYSQTK